MAQEFQKELDKSRFHIVKYGLVYILIVIGLTFLSLTLIEIDGVSILSLAVDYYFR